MGTILKCKICGGSLAFKESQKIVICEYCGTKQVLPLFSDDSAQMLYERGTNYLRQNEYDKAENIFTQLISLSPSDPEIYWNLVLCKYGVTFVKDAASGKYIPTCNRTHFQSVFQDDNYKKAIEYSEEEKVAFYSENAEIIDKIQKGILVISKKEKPYDIFISYKETDIEGNRTQDSMVAQELYDKLNDLGYKVFFSRITLESKVGEEYEPYIFAALSSSKVMLTVSSCKEYLESAWVKNEWSRFLTLRRNDTGKLLIPLYFSMQKDELPEEFAILPSQDMREGDFEQELLRGIKKVIPVPINTSMKRKKGIGFASVALVVFIVIAGVLYLNLQKKNKQIENSIDKVEQYNHAVELFDAGNYIDAKEIFEKLGDYNDSAKQAERCVSQAQYDIAMEYFGAGDYDKAREEFLKIEGYEDSSIYANKCLYQADYDNAMELYSKGLYPQSAWDFAKLTEFEDSKEMQLKAETSWRKALAVPYTVDTDGYSSASYYITVNGTVENIPGTTGTAHNGIDIAVHGKVVSIAFASKLYALHEDGYVTNAKENNGLDDDSSWKNIIKISDKVDRTNFALKADGTMVYGNLMGEPSWGTDEWISGVSSWNSIIDFEYEVWPTDLWESGGVIIGIKSDGTLCGICRMDDGIAGGPLDNDRLKESEDNDRLKEILDKFSDVVNFKFELNSYDNLNNINVIALTSKGTLQIYQNGVFTENEGQDICQILSTSKLLKNDGDVIDVQSKKVLMHDVVNSVQDRYITKSGNISDCNVKTQIYDEWLRRLN